MEDELRDRMCGIEIEKCQCTQFYSRAEFPLSSITSLIILMFHVQKPPGRNYKMSQFVQDIALYYQSSNVLPAVEELQQAGETLCHWLDHVRISHGKSSFLLFTLKRNVQQLTPKRRNNVLQNWCQISESTNIQQ